MKRLALLERGSVTALLALHLAVFFAGFWAPYDPAEQNRFAALHPPARVRFFDSRGNFHFRPFLYDADGSPRRIEFFVPGSPYRLAGLWTVHVHFFGVAEPGRIFLLGTDEFGRDQLSRALWGGRISLLTGWMAALISLTIGLVLGATAGFFGNWCDSALMRGSELFLALPWLYLLLAVRAFLPLSTNANVMAVILAVIIGCVGWARPARLVRGIVLSVKEREYVSAARGFGASPLYLLRRHCLPETYGVLLTQAALLIPQYMLAEVALSFVGLGVPEPAASWGTLLAPLRHVSILSTSWWMLLPALFILLTSWCFLSLEDILAENRR